MYAGAPFDYFIYDSAKLGQVRNFATSPNIQIMIVTVGAINKKDVNNLYKDSEKTAGESHRSDKSHETDHYRGRTAKRGRRWKDVVKKRLARSIRSAPFGIRQRMLINIIWSTGLTLWTLMSVSW